MQQDLGGAQHHGQQVVVVVRDRARQPRHGVHAVRAPQPALELFALGDVPEAGDDRPDLRLRDAVDTDPLDGPPRAVAVADPILRYHGHVRPRCRGREALPRVLEIVGMDEVEGAASHQLRRGVAEQAGGGGAGIHDLGVGVDLVGTGPFPDRSARHRMFQAPVFDQAANRSTESCNDSCNGAVVACRPEQLVVCRLAN